MRTRRQGVGGEPDLKCQGRGGEVRNTGNSRHIVMPAMDVEEQLRTTVLGVADQCIIAVAAAQIVDAGSADERVVSSISVEIVGPCAAIERIVATAAGEGVRRLRSHR